MANILIIEDNAAQREALEEFLTATGDEHRVYLAPDGELARAVFKERALDLIISDLMLPDTTGIELVREFRQSSDIPFLIITGEPSIESAVEAIQLGANDYLTKPVDLRLLKKKVEALLEGVRLRVENRNLRARLSDTFHADKIIGNATALHDVLEKCRQVAPADVTVLIEGESGTGKELIANLLHENSARSSRPFIKVNCGAITRTLLESELFGAVKGAYTGADRSRPGYFESANGGTIFLDEIGEMDLESQVRLLRVIEEKEVVRIGSSKATPVDVRIIAATNKNLIQAVDAGDFREDLYYRLAVIRLQLPALRERTDDIPVLFNHFVTQFNEKYNKSVTRMAPDLLDFFQAYNWPGNIRQFRNVIEGMVVLATEDVLEKKDLPRELQSGPRTDERRLQDNVIAGISLEDYERAIIARNLQLHGGNREKTAQVLGISERTLYRKIKDYDLAR
ncbi:MAG: sigma-54-dependent Fis family transcriptional regulator [Leptospiraceae bacterium]|nr:sigma-54-dependent Fis family transcriptional regulator [Leptospiraceae bacterium]MCB1315799.1 sigma-54-dependent Fis family transcriptional regulator [Leptospiraceae bacterium]